MGLIPALNTVTTDKYHYLIIPGWNGSSTAHWQSHWQALLKASRVEQANWEKPLRECWVSALSDAINRSDKPLILIAHSLGCITIAHWACSAATAELQKIAGALLVAPADVEREQCPSELTNFSPIPLQPLPFPSLVIASSNDAAATAERALYFAKAWQSQYQLLANAGHINVASGHAQWNEGFVYLQKLLLASQTISTAQHIPKKNKIITN